MTGRRDLSDTLSPSLRAGLIRVCARGHTDYCMCNLAASVAVGSGTIHIVISVSPHNPDAGRTGRAGGAPGRRRHGINARYIRHGSTGLSGLRLSLAEATVTRVALYRTHSHRDLTNQPSSISVLVLQVYGNLISRTRSPCPSNPTVEERSARSSAGRPIVRPQGLTGMRGLRLHREAQPDQQGAQNQSSSS